MNLQNRVEKLEQQTGASTGVKFVVVIPPRMTREEWAEHAREFTERGGFTVNLKAAEVTGDEFTEQS